mmetsp:Transcript_13888/g.38526  ORF Transcript_13888/g.38526 Transcript_13888/m.38526 type:complete len:208 (+) Transcript_13888:721-1344(+)
MTNSCRRLTQQKASQSSEAWDGRITSWRLRTGWSRTNCLSMNCATSICAAIRMPPGALVSCTAMSLPSGWRRSGLALHRGQHGERKRDRGWFIWATSATVAGATRCQGQGSLVESAGSSTSASIAFHACAGSACAARTSASPVTAFASAGSTPARVFSQLASRVTFTGETPLQGMATIVARFAETILASIHCFAAAATPARMWWLLR